MNLGIELLPPECTVLVVGAGPAGSAAAGVLARAGVDVVLVDQQAFPRDKICGDGLIPDAHHALRRLGVLDQVMARARSATHVRCVGPRGAHIDVPGELAVLPRRELDDIVCRGAVASGARMHAPVRFIAPIEAHGVVVGARLAHRDTVREVRAQWVLLASGAVPQALIAAGMAQRQTPSGVALRGYVRNPRMVPDITALHVVWHRALTPGYGWIFPCRDGVFNIGVGIADSHSQRSGGRYAKVESNLHDVMQQFEAVYELTRAGMLVLGEAAGSTYSFTGEGIGKALETGIHAAEAVLTAAHRRAGAAGAGADADVRADYEARLTSLRPRFELYRRANVVNRHPWLTDLLIWRANKSPRIVRRMSGVLQETSNPGNLVSVKGIARLFLDRQ